MATQLTVQKGALVITPTANAQDAAGNYVVAAIGDEVLIRFANTSGGAITVTLTDPTSTSPENATAFNASVAVSVPATTGVRYIWLDASRLARFRDPSTGRINYTTSAQTGLSCEVVGF
jgi:hypothetical protein